MERVSLQNLHSKLLRLATVCQKEQSNETFCWKIRISLAVH